LKAVSFAGAFEGMLSIKALLVLLSLVLVEGLIFLLHEVVDAGVAAISHD
jgi:hypothetical protein